MAAGRLALAHELVGASRTDARPGPGARPRAGAVRPPISSFQAIRHRLAETLVAIETADAVLDAAWLDGTADSAAMAKAMAGRGARTAARHCQQVLAGIGFTTEHDLHRFIRRTLVLDALLGTSVRSPGRSATTWSPRGRCRRCSRSDQRSGDEPMSSTTLPTAWPVGDEGQRGRRVVERERRPDVGHDAAVGQEAQQLGLVAGQLVGVVGGEVDELEAEDLAPLEQHQVQRDPGDLAGGVADGDEPPAVAQRTQGRLGQGAADGIDDDVGRRRAGPGAGRRAGRPARWSIRRGRPARRGGVELGRVDDATAVTVAPRWTPSCTAARPTPPPAPSTTSSSPGCIRATERSTW